AHGCWGSDVGRERGGERGGKMEKMEFGGWREALCIAQGFKRGLDREGVLFLHFTLSVLGVNKN
nr:hypothetical protein [Tanacetum cinerariifolium]